MPDNFLQNVPSLPRYMEGGYSPLGRSPVVDALLGDPLYVPTYAEIVAKQIKELAKDDLFYPLQKILLTAGGVPGILLNSNKLLPRDVEVPKIFLEAFPKAIAKSLYTYWIAFMAIQREVEQLLSVLTEVEKNWLKEHYNHFFFATHDKEADYDFFTSDSPYSLKFFELASKIDLAKLSFCAQKLSVIVDEFTLSRHAFETLKLEYDFVWEENNLKLIVSSKSHAEHSEEADFFIDLGGHNVIYTNAGGTQGVRSLALHIDVKGHNTYRGQNFVQGSGFLGVGMLVSYGGHNTYTAESYAQGCGFFGAGSLINFQGNNKFAIDFGGQAFGLFGSSVVWNKQGSNEYVAYHGMAQAASSTLGIAYLIDTGGSGSYQAGVPGKNGLSRFGGIGQGGSIGVRNDPWLNNPSFYGGLAFLYLGEGNNKLSNVWLGQGSAYFLSAGIVVAEGSHDVFKADYDAQGQGLHLAVGLLLKKGGHGQCKGGWGSLGVSGDRSVGIFLGMGDNNVFEGTDQCIGTSRKPKSVGMFINIGGNNTYVFNKLSCARLQFPQSPKEWSQALFLEIGSDSVYPDKVDEFQRGNDQEWGVRGHSVGLSTQFLNAESTKILSTIFHEVPQLSLTFDPLNGWLNNTAYQALEQDMLVAQKLAGEIGSANYDRRRQIYENLDLFRFKNRKVNYDLSYLLQDPAHVAEDAFTYAVLWALRNKDKVDLTGVKNALKTGSFLSNYAKKMAVSLVATYWTPENVSLFSTLMLGHEPEDVRYSAALALTLHDSLAEIKEGVTCDSEVVRYAIAKGLQEHLSPSALAIAESLFNDSSFYVRRAAGLSAISLGDKSGVSVVLDTLQHDSLDTEDNYGNNIYKQLSNYLKVDFGLDKQAWINWWNQEKL